jgi:magnesium-transporting ATPase (P-type)
MGTLMLAIGAGLFYNMIVFYICEEKSLKNADLSDMKCLVKEEVDMSECFEKYNTFQYMFIYLVSAFIFAFIVAKLFLIPSGADLAAMMAYTFIPSMIGSLLILLVKWRYQPFIKLASSFMYGSGYMTATGIAVALVYFLK